MQTTHYNENSNSCHVVPTNFPGGIHVKASSHGDGRMKGFVFMNRLRHYFNPDDNLSTHLYFPYLQPDSRYAA